MAKGALTMPQPKGSRSASKLQARSHEDEKQEVRCYQDLIGENEKTPTQQPSTRLRRTQAYPDLPRSNASYELAKFLRDTGPERPEARMSTEATETRSKSLPRQLMQRFVRKSKSDIRQENSSKSKRFTYDALKGHWVALGAEQTSPSLPAGLPEGVVQKTTSDGKKYLALRLPLEIKGDGCIDYSYTTHDIPLEDIQPEDLTGLTSDQVIDGWLQDLRAKSIKNTRLSTASSMAVGQLSAFLPSEKSQPSVHPALRGLEDGTPTISSASASDSYSLCSEGEHSEERHMASTSSEDLLATPKARVTSITVTECPPDVPMRSPARDSHRMESEPLVQPVKTTPPHVSISKMSTARPDYVRSSSAGDLLFAPSNKMLTGQDGRCKSMASQLDAAAMESIITSINWTLHKKTAGLPVSRYADASNNDATTDDQRRDSVSPLSSTFNAISRGKPAVAENIRAVITPTYSSSQSSHSRGNSSSSSVSHPLALNVIPEQPTSDCPSPRSLSPMSMRKPEARSKPKYRKDPRFGIRSQIAGGQAVSPIEWNLNGASWLAEPSDDSERSHSVASLTETGRPVEQPIRRLHSAAANSHTTKRPAPRRARVNAGSTGSPRHANRKSEDSRSLQSFMPAGHFPSAPSPAPNKALPPLPAISSPTHMSSSTQRSHVSVPRRKPVPQAGNAFRGNGAESPQKRTRLWLTPSNQDLSESYAVNCTPPLSSPLTNMVDLEVLEDHLTELQYRASQLSAMVIDMYNHGGLDRTPGTSLSHGGRSARLLL
ncbi:hypothetical protein LTR86_003390 [Recurvomyces mirabilis]|nr:hypothetical protein LTR86_003390 [Recurvomyces mirabilis]